MQIEDIKSFLNLGNIKEDLIWDAINEASNYLKKYGIDTNNQDIPDIQSAHKYMTAYFLLPQLSVIIGNQGVSKQIGLGESSQQLISEHDIQLKQSFYYQHAMKIVKFLNQSDYLFGIDI
ncbi:MAG: hypothetical protein RBS16_01880 [Candidatus Cloacimonadales bacterium]|jgi:hypothetical protein|nr:hypothetical protein [Candidatus Cloacimonadota bacterium]MDX9976762.1 hypothetical protein [Candidatus Cloacimonadales bacterium]